MIIMTKPQVEEITMPSPLDLVEQEYELALRRARDADEAYELSVGLQQYRQLYKTTNTQED